MAATTDDAVEINEFLTYLKAYRVVICKTCQFAIQSNALSSHLQKHRVLRRQRRELLARLSRLPLAVPTGVCSPPASTSPILGLPCYSGFKCEHVGCQYACTSKKRMSQHWSQIHGCPSHLQVRARPAKVQTFFRGTQIRYFEVSDAIGETFVSRHEIAKDSTAIPGLSSVDQSSCQSTGDSVASTDDIQQVNIKFDRAHVKAMMYLHFYTTSSGTGLGLGLGSDTFWTHDLPRQASDYPFLLYILLAVAACHQACIAISIDETHEHTQAARNYYSLSLPLFRETMKKPDINNGSALAATARCLGIIDLVLSRLEDEDKFRDTNYRMTSTEAIQSLNKFIIMLRGSLDMLLELQEYVTENSGMRLSAEEKACMAKFTLITGSSSDKQTPALQTPRTIPYSTEIEAPSYRRISLLPSRLASNGIVSEEEISLASRCTEVLLEFLHRCNNAPDKKHWHAWSARQGWTLTVAAREFLTPGLSQGMPLAIMMLAYYIYHLLGPTEELYWFTNRLTSYMITVCRIALRDEPRYLSLLDELSAL